jgi:hypothetical protein
VHCSPGRRQLKLSDRAWEAPNFFNQRLRRHWPERHTEPGHSCADRPSKPGQVLDGLLAGGLRLALGVPGLVQGGPRPAPEPSATVVLGFDL